MKKAIIAPGTEPSQTAATVSEEMSPVAIWILEVFRSTVPNEGESGKYTMRLLVVVARVLPTYLLPFAEVVK